MERDRLLEALEYIPCAGIDRADWVKIGMALKEEGYPVSTWEAWSQTDPARYKSGECERIWNGFSGSGTPVAGGTVVQMAEGYGYVARRYDGDGALGFDSEIEWDGEESKTNSPTVSDWNPTKDVVTYLETLFEPGDYVGYVTTDVEKTADGKWVPCRSGAYDRTAGELISELRKHPTDIGAVLGDANPEAGAWCRINGLDGHGVGNKNVCSFKNALVESDTLPIPEQIKLYKRLNLPIQTLTASGGKSVHAVVRVDAKDRREYDERVDFLYDYLGAHGLEIDRQNRNPSRLSRMPGFMRAGKRQQLLATKIGAKSWTEWVEFTEGDPDGLPELDFPAEMTEPEKRPPLAPELISGLLRQGHKMLFSAASKAGKSFTLMQLAICLSNGLDFLGFPCKQGKVLYVNLEIDRASCLNRLFTIADAMGAQMSDGLAVWNLRGRAMALNKLAPKIVRVAKGQGYEAIIIDPIYKVLAGDENSAGEMGAFCNSFDKICTETGASVIYAHHHSKGAQGGKAAQDRASGSGVFARDPDAIVDFTELELSDDIKNNVRDSVTDSAWQVEFVTREFAQPPLTKIWFRYPLHELDTSGELSGCYPRGDSRNNLKQTGGGNAQAEKDGILAGAFSALSGGRVTIPLREIVEYLTEEDENAKTVERRVRRWLDKSSKFELMSGKVRPKEIPNF